MKVWDPIRETEVEVALTNESELPAELRISELPNNAEWVDENWPELAPVSSFERVETVEPKKPNLIERIRNFFNGKKQD